VLTSGGNRPSCAVFVGHATCSATVRTSVMRASTKVATAISTSRTATSKNIPVETRLMAIPTLVWRIPRQILDRINDVLNHLNAHGARVTGNSYLIL
jgi:hypothetical protein